MRVRKAKMHNYEEWIRLGEEMEKDAKGMQKRFWSRVKAKEKETVTDIRVLYAVDKGLRGRNVLQSLLLILLRICSRSIRPISTK